MKTQKKLSNFSLLKNIIEDVFISPRNVFQILLVIVLLSFVSISLVSATSHDFNDYYRINSTVDIGKVIHDVKEIVLLVKSNDLPMDDIPLKSYTFVKKSNILISTINDKFKNDNIRIIKILIIRSNNMEK